MVKKLILSLFFNLLQNRSAQLTRSSGKIKNKTTLPSSPTHWEVYDSGFSRISYLGVVGFLG